MDGVNDEVEMGITIEMMVMVNKDVEEADALSRPIINVDKDRH